MIFCKELNKEFATKEEMFAAIVKNLDKIFEVKKKEIFSCNKGLAVSLKSLNGLKLNDEQKAAFKMDEGYYYVVVNTTNILDSHTDLHLDGIWDDSVPEQQGKVYLCADHLVSLNTVIVKKEYIEILIVPISFAALGKDYKGNTQALVYKFPKDKVVNDAALKWLESGDEIQASVRMRYLDLEFAMDSNDPDYKKQKAAYDKYIKKVANIDDFEYVPYFFAIKKAENVIESSLVIYGSNHVTGNLFDNEDSNKEDLNKEFETPQGGQTKSNFYNIIH